MLLKEEELSYKMGKKSKGRDLAALQNVILSAHTHASFSHSLLWAHQIQSLQKRIRISNEMNRLSNENRNCADTLLQSHIENIVRVCTRCTALEMEATEKMGEGLVKIGADAFAVQLPSYPSSLSPDASVLATPPEMADEQQHLDREIVQLSLRASDLDLKSPRRPR